MDKQVSETELSPKEEIQELVERSRAAQKQIENYTQEQVDDMTRGEMSEIVRLYNSSYGTQQLENPDTN